MEYKSLYKALENNNIIFPYPNGDKLTIVGWGNDTTIYDIKLTRHILTKNCGDILITLIENGRQSLSNELCSGFGSCHICCSAIVRTYLINADFTYSAKHISKSSRIERGYFDICGECLPLLSNKSHRCSNKTYKYIEDTFNNLGGLNKQINKTFYIATPKYLSIFFHTSNKDNVIIEYLKIKIVEYPILRLFSFPFDETKYGRELYRNVNDDVKHIYRWLKVAPYIIAIMRFDLIMDVKRYIMIFFI
jgi:hypothetical protein